MPHQQVMANRGALSCRLGDPDALLWSTTPQSGEARVPTVLAHSGAESDKCSVVECMDWQSAGTMLATGSMDGWVRVWNKSGISLHSEPEPQGNLIQGKQHCCCCLGCERHDRASRQGLGLMHWCFSDTVILAASGMLSAAAAFECMWRHSIMP